MMQYLWIELHILICDGYQ